MTNIRQDETIRKNFLLSQSLFQKANDVGEKTGLNFSEVVRTALEDYIHKIERQRLEQQLIEACKFYNNIDKEIAKEWKEAEAAI
jgi:antitoxin component of RelBE/YafQ-DinJ toxin-antitoxin module